jgi:DNA-binding MarR family transcriptional regulator
MCESHLAGSKPAARTIFHCFRGFARFFGDPCLRLCQLVDKVKYFVYYKDIDRVRHFCWHGSCRMRIFFNRWQAVSAADVVSGVFIAQRDLLQLLRSHALAGSGLTAELAEILLELFMAGNAFSSQEHVDADGYIAFRDLRASLGYSAGLLSRRIAWLYQRRWAETTRAAPSVANGLHGNSQKVRITDSGREKIGPVWRRYDKLAERLLAGISPSDLAAHYRINEFISDKLRAPRSWMDDSEMPEEDRPPVARPTKVAPRVPNPPATVRVPAAALEPAPTKYLLETEGEFLD